MNFNEFCDQLIERTDIVALVSRYCSLKRSGSRYFACCPFHGERTPSFSVSPDSKLFYCFGCHKGGNAITFLRDIENIDSIDAIKMLASEAGMEVPELPGRINPKKVDKDKQARLYKLLTDAARHYNENLKGDKAEAAREYLKKRAVPENVITRFGLGYSVNGYEMIDYLTRKGYSPEDVKAAGIAGQKEQSGEAKARYYDVYHERLMFPIINSFGQVVGFGGRVLVKTDFAKYRNTAGTELFDKSKTLYAINLLKKKKQSGEQIKYVIICEGYMDVIALHKAGFDTAVASMGTALTPQQARIIKNYSENVIVSYDGDSAGQKGALRSLDILNENGLNVRVAALPEGLDPDEVINRYGVDGYRKCLTDSYTLTEFKLRVLRKDYDLSDKDGRSKYAKKAVALISELKDPVAIEEYLKVVSSETGYGMDILREQSGISSAKKPEEKKDEDVLAGIPAEAQFILSAFIKGKGYVNAADLSVIDKDAFIDAVIASVTESRLKELKDCSALLYTDIPEEMTDKATALIEKDFSGNDNAEYYAVCVHALALEQVKNRIKEATEQFSKSDSEEDKKKLLKEIQQLNGKLKMLKTSGGSKVNE